MAKVIMNWTTPDNGLKINGPIIFDTNAEFEELFEEGGELHEDVAQAVKGTEMGYMVDVWPDDDYEYDECHDVNNTVSACMIAFDMYIVNVVYIAG